MITGPTSVSASSGSPTFMKPAAPFESLDELVVDASLGDDPRGGGADLPGVEAPHRSDAGDGGLEVGVVEDDARALAAELHQEALHVATGDLADALAHTGGAR